MRGLFGIALAVGLVITAAGCGKKQDTPKSDDAPKAEGNPKPALPEPTPPKPTTPKPPADLTNVKADVTFTAKEFETASMKDFFFVKKQHPGKVVEVSGVVKEYGGGGIGSVVVILEGDGIGPMFKLSDKQAWLKALPRQTVILRTVVPTDPNTLAIDWQIIAVTGSPPPTLTAEEFRKSNSGLRAIEMKYGKCQIIVTGTIAEVKVNADGGRLVQLNSSRQRRKCCHFQGDLSYTSV